MSAARDEVLRRVATAVRDRAGPEPPREYRRVGKLTAAERVQLFCSRVGEYKATVHRVRRDGVAEVVASVSREHGMHQLVVPVGLPISWRPHDLELIEDTGLDPHALDRLDGVVTGSTVAIAETGTIALTGRAAEGRRALTLVPDLHVCIVEAGCIVELVPEAMSILADLVARERRPVTLVSGPSATSDIELKRVEGVHGPRTLIVVVVQEEQ